MGELGSKRKTASAIYIHQYCMTNIFVVSNELYRCAGHMCIEFEVFIHHLLQLFLNEGTMSSCQSTADNTQLDPDYIADEPKVTVSSFLKLPLEKMGAELARSAAGSEDNARIITLAANITYDKVGATGPRPVVTRSMVEEAIRKDGDERVLSLANLNMRGKLL